MPDFLSRLDLLALRFDLIYAKSEMGLRRLQIGFRLAQTLKLLLAPHLANYCFKARRSLRIQLFAALVGQAVVGVAALVLSSQLLTGLNAQNFASVASSVQDSGWHFRVRLKHFR